MTKVSVIVPVYNEEATIIQLLEAVARQNIEGVTFEIIVIDDGSRDKTVSLLQDRPRLYSELIVLPVNGGKGVAVKAGLGAASGDYILFQDADLEYDPEDYEKLMLPVLKFGADLVLGSRFVAPQYTRVSYFWHKIGNKLVTFLFNLLNNTTFTDIYSCYLMYRRSLLAPEQLITTGWEQHAEILSRVFTRAKSVYEVPISYRGRTYEEGKKIMAHHVISVTWTIVVRRLFR